MFNLILFLIFSYVGFVLSVCPSDDLKWQSNCLFFNSTPTGFGNAESVCQKAHGRLASIHDAFYNSILAQNASLHFMNTNVTDFWIGATKYTWDESWIWDDGTALNYTDWRKGEPNNSTGRDCAASSWVDGFWSAQDCSNLKPFVCEIPERLFTTTAAPEPPPTATSNPVGANCSDGWKYFQPTGSCYLKIEISQNWTTSKSQCQSLGGDLASIHTGDELYFLYLNYIKPSKNPSVWIGLYSDDNENSWKWSDNSLFDYSPWLDGYPQNANGANCGYIIVQQEDVHYDTYFANTQCDETFNAICKKVSSVN